MGVGTLGRQKSVREPEYLSTGLPGTVFRTSFAFLGGIIDLILVTDTLTRRDHTGCPQDLHLRVLQHRRPLRNLRSRRAVRQSLPAAAGQQAILLGARGRWSEPQEVPDEWECGRCADGAVCGCLCLFTRPDMEVGRLMNRRFWVVIPRVCIAKKQTAGALGCFEGVYGGWRATTNLMLERVSALVPRKPLRIFTHITFSFLCPRSPADYILHACNCLSLVP